jgi:hypothetical protein
MLLAQESEDTKTQWDEFDAAVFDRLGLAK